MRIVAALSVQRRRVRDLEGPASHRLADCTVQSNCGSANSRPGELRFEPRRAATAIRPSRSSPDSAADRRRSRGGRRCGTTSSCSGTTVSTGVSSGCDFGIVIRKSFFGIEQILDPVVVLGRQRDHRAAARLRLLDVPHHLLEDVIVRRNRDDGHGLVDERDRAVLHLAGRIALGVNVGDLLELQRAFERDRIVDAAPEIEEVAALVEALGDLLGERLALERLLEQQRQLRQRLPGAAAPASGLSAPRICPR